ncbi:ribonuclease HII [bacterium]|nr:ribonuclease HII [bacterium]
MQTPNLQLERSLYRRGHKTIAGADEAGRGAWAGPLVAAAVILPTTIKLPTLRKVGLNDSKLLNPKSRVLAWEWITNNCWWGVGQVPEQEIDKHGLSWANQKAIELALAGLSSNFDWVLIDGRVKIPSRKHSCIIAGDSKSYSIAAASIVAKVTRDRLMQKLSKKHKLWEFETHKGYGTRAHQQALQKHGICVLHRKSFAPIAELVN